MSTRQSSPGDRRSGNSRSGGSAFASGKSPKSGRHLVGRRDEVAAIQEMLASVRGGESGTLLFTGEPGIGKTALTEEARALAEGFTCLSCRGVVAESALAHAGLLALLTPLRHLIGEVPEGQAAALGGALGWRAAGNAADRFLVGAATLSLLAAAAATGPVLVVVDDLHWLDRESAEAIAFAARRLGGDAVGFLLNGRAGELAPELTQGFATVELGGLTYVEATELLPRDVSAAVATRVHAVTGGNPLALLEVAGRLSAEERAGAAPLPDPLPTGARLHTVYDAALTTLPGPVRNALLLVALDPAAAVGAGMGEALDEAVARGVLIVDRSGPRFRHPLLRSAVLRLAGPSELRSAHEHLAALSPPGGLAQVRHLAAAASGVDDDLAAALARAADDDRSRSGYAAASADLERSASLTSDPQAAAAKLSRAAQDAFLAGDLTRTRNLVQRVLGTSAAGETRGRALFTLGMLEQYAGSVVQAADVLAQASALLRGPELVDALSERCLVAFRLSDLDVIAECATRIEVEANSEDPAQRLRSHFTIGLARFVAGDYRGAAALLGQLTDLALSDELREDPRALLLMALAAGLSGTVEDAVRRGASRVEDIRRRGAIGVLVQLLALTAAAHAIVGDHTRAFTEAGEAVELAECLGYVADAAVAVEQLAWQSAARGFHDDARVALDRARDLLDRAETTSAAAHHALTAAFCALCRDDHGEVVRLLEARLEADGGLGAMGEPLGVAPLLIEAYVGLGRTRDANDLTERLGEVTPDASPPSMLAALLRSQGLTAPDPDESQAFFDRALAVLAEHPEPYEHARTRLLSGSRLRRDGRRVAARAQLAAAQQAFEAMELTRWADAAAAELRATGANPRARSVATQDSLTSQETRVALLVAEGRSNKEVAAALFLSPRTIERHLGNVFRKRGFRSRAELVRAYAEQHR
jgi:DNA-binding CsgD family transcriptional regulator